MPLPLSHRDHIELAKLAIEKWAEIVCERMDKDLREFKTPEGFDEFYKRAYWRRFTTLALSASEQVTRATNVEEQLKLIQEMYGDQLGLPSSALPLDVKNRLDWLKRRIAKDFELEITRLIDEKEISSPVEQIFLMEWKFAGIDKKLNVRLTPHEPVSTTDRSYEVDFLIVPEDPSMEGVKIAIEIDGHEFHERSKSQVRKDKARERAIVRQGVTVLRFSGSEVVHNARGCVEEVEQLLRSRFHV